LSQLRIALSCSFDAHALLVELARIQPARLDAELALRRIDGAAP